ncbi:tumor necrosis factor receptor superfamily member 4 isoform X4 [Marmota flaviventris]|uniref:tumor necrosis factor receptor superfamily member 4 isoform X4 n=1 Tax=Marmota flaviventris TaxID=93162 RepID=UPI003A8C6340
MFHITQSVPSVSPSGLGQKGHIKNGVPHQLPGKGQWAERTGVFQRPSTHPLAMGVSTSPTGPNSRNLRGQSSKTSGVLAADCAPCPAGHFSPGDNKACKPWTNCTLTGKRTLKPGSMSSDTLCEDRTSPGALPWETQGPTARPTTALSTAALPGTSLGPSTPPSEARRGLPLAAVLGLGLSLLAPLAVLLALRLHGRAWRSSASGPPFKRNSPTHTPPWPRSESILGVGFVGQRPRHRPPTCALHTVLGAGPALGSPTYVVHTTCPTAPQ